MPVWGVWLDGMFFFSTGRRSSKSRNLTANPKCTVNPDGAGEAVILEGVAREVSETARLRRFASVYKKKYDWNIERGKDPTYAVQPTLVFGFVESSDKIRGNPTRWKFGS